MSKLRCLLALVFLASIALVPVASWADAIHDRPRIPIHPQRPIHPDIPSICDAVAGNLVNNCGFEKGNFLDWTVRGVVGGQLVVENRVALVHSGDFAIEFGALGAFDDSISQVLSTTAGRAFELSFFLRNLASASADKADFSASWDGKSVLSAPTTAFGYTQYHFLVPGTGSDTLQFAGRQNVGFYGLDDIVVTPLVTPEPSTLSLFGLGLLLVGALLARKKKLLNGAQS